MIWLDFETRSACDLKSRGVYNYAQDLTTEVLCMSYAVDDGEVLTWLPGQPLPKLTGHRIMAHFRSQAERVSKSSQIIFQSPLSRGFKN